MIMGKQGRFGGFLNKIVFLRFGNTQFIFLLSDASIFYKSQLFIGRMTLYPVENSYLVVKCRETNLASDWLLYCIIRTRIWLPRNRLLLGLPSYLFIYFFSVTPFTLFVHAKGKLHFRKMDKQSNQNKTKTKLRAVNFIYVFNACRYRWVCQWCARLSQVSFMYQHRWIL